MTYEEEIRKLTKAQRGVLDSLAMGVQMWATKRTLDALRTRGLIVGRPMKDGALHWTEYDVPPAVHIAWAQVGTEDFDALSPEEQAAMEAPDVQL